MSRKRLRTPRLATLAGCVLSTLAAPAISAQTSPAHQRAAIHAACRSGALTPEECRSKLAALRPGSADTPAGMADPSAARQKAAIQAACESGILGPDECRSKLAALGSGPAESAGAATDPGNPLANAAADAGSPPARANGGEPAGARSVPGSTTFRHPQGLYSISVPRGWQVDTSQASPKLTHGSTWATLDTSASNSEPGDVVQRTASQMGGMLSTFKVTDKGDFTTLHSHPASGETANADVPTRTGSDPRTFVFWTQTDGEHHFVTLTASMDQAAAPETITLLMQVFNSLRFANE